MFLFDLSGWKTIAGLQSKTNLHITRFLPASEIVQILFLIRKSSSCCWRLMGDCRYLQFEHDFCLSAQSGQIICPKIGLFISCSRIVFNSCGVFPVKPELRTGWACSRRPTQMKSAEFDLR